MQCNGHTIFKNTIKRTQYKNIQQLISNVRKYLTSDDHYSHQYTSIYSAVSDILFILLLIYSITGTHCTCTMCSKVTEPLIHFYVALAF